MNIALSNAFIILKTRADSNLTYLDFLPLIITAFDRQKTEKHASPILRSNREGNKASGREIQFDMPDENEPHLLIIGNQER